MKTADIFQHALYPLAEVRLRQHLVYNQEIVFLAWNCFQTQVQVSKL